MIFYFTVLTFIKTSTTNRNPQIVITDSAPEIIPLSDNVTYNIHTDDRGVVTVTTLDQGLSSPRTEREIYNSVVNEVATANNNLQGGGEFVLGYAPTPEEVSNSMFHPIIRVEDYQTPGISTGNNDPPGQSNGSNQAIQGNNYQSPLATGLSSNSSSLPTTNYSGQQQYTGNGGLFIESTLGGQQTSEGGQNQNITQDKQSKTDSKGTKDKKDDKTKKKKKNKKSEQKDDEDDDPVGSKSVQALQEIYMNALLTVILAL